MKSNVFKDSDKPIIKTVFKKAPCDHYYACITQTRESASNFNLLSYTSIVKYSRRVLYAMYAMGREVWARAP